MLVAMSIVSWLEGSYMLPLLFLYSILICSHFSLIERFSTGGREVNETYKSPGALKTYRIHQTPTQGYRHLAIAREIMPLAQLSVIPTRSFWYSGVDFLVTDLLLSHSWTSK